MMVYTCMYKPCWNHVVPHSVHRQNKELSGLHKPLLLGHATSNRVHHFKTVRTFYSHSSYVLMTMMGGLTAQRVLKWATFHLKLLSYCTGTP